MKKLISHPIFAAFAGALLALIAYDMFISKAIGTSSYEEYDMFEDADMYDDYEPVSHFERAA